MRPILAIMALAAALLTGSGGREPVSVGTGRIDPATVEAPAGSPTSLVVYLSDIAGWQRADSDVVAALLAAGSAVVPLDLSAYAGKLDADQGECLYVVGELTDLAQKAQRALGLADYLAPIVAGRGAGATFAYAALADAPPNTLGGAVGLEFDDRLPLRLPFCPGAASSKLPGGGYSYAFDHALPEQARLLVARASIGIAKAAAREANLELDTLSDAPLGAQAAAAVATLPKASDFAGMPVVRIGAQGARRGLVVFVSGDGGWRDLDKTMGEWMASRGYEVLGTDALRFFWSTKRPARFAADIERAVVAADPAGTMPVLLVGYSFGADVLPFAWPKLPPGLRDRTRLVALLAPGRETGFQITVSGWLGMAGGSNEVVPAIAAMPAAKVLCVHGADERASACTDPSLAAIRSIETKGGHHFDGDYRALGERVLAAFSERAAQNFAPTSGGRFSENATRKTRS